MKTLHGTFHLPSDPDDKFGGILRRVEGAIEFEVVGWDMMTSRHDVIVGVLSDGNAVTLVEVQRTMMRMGVHGPRPIFRVWHMLIGWPFDALSNIVFDRASCTFTDLSDWWEWRSGFQFSDGASPGGTSIVLGPSIAMTYARAATMKASLPGLEIEAGPNEAQQADSRRYAITTSTRVRFEWAPRQSMKRLFSDIDAMEALLWVLLDQPSLPRSISAQNDSLKAQVFGGDSDHAQPIEIRTSLRTPRPLDSGGVLLPRPDEIAPHFDALCKGWYARWEDDRSVLGSMAEAATESSRRRLVSRPVQLAWYMAHAKSLDAIWLLLHPERRRRVEHIDVLHDLFASHGPCLFPDRAKRPDWEQLAVEMYGIRNDAGHPPQKPKRPLEMRDIERGQDLTAVLGRTLLLEAAGLPRDVAVGWVTQGRRWQRFINSQQPGAAL